MEKQKRPKINLLLFILRCLTSENKNIHMDDIRVNYITVAEISTGIVAIALITNKTTKVSLGINPSITDAVKAAIFLTIGQIISQKLLYTAFQ